MVPTPDQMTSDHRRELRVNRQTFSVDIRPGRESGVPLLMFGGIGASYEVLQPLVDAIDAEVEVIRVDVPGVGRSPAAPFPYVFPQLASSIAGLLDDLGYRKVDVLGYSWGGALAQQFALQYPHRCRRLVLISTSTGAIAVPGDSRVLREMLTPRHFSDPEDAALVAELLDGGVNHRPTPAARRMLRSVRSAAAGQGYFHQLMAVATWTSLPFLWLLRQPVLILSGENDPIVPVINARILRALIPHAALEVFPGGHLEIVNSAPDLGQRVSRFLRR